MAIRNRTIGNVGYGLTNALENLAPAPIQANRAPSTSDSGQIGQIWIFPATDSAWVLVSNANASATWEPISQGGAGTFTSLTVNPGPVNMLTDTATAVGNFGTGAGVKTIAVGSTNSTSTTTISGGSGAGAVLIQANTGDISLVGGAGSIIAISNDATAGTIDIGAATTVVKTIDIGSTNTTSSVTVNAGTTTGFIALNAVGNISVSPITAMAASPTASVTANHNLITATFHGLFYCIYGHSSVYDCI